MSHVKSWKIAGAVTVLGLAAALAARDAAAKDAGKARAAAGYGDALQAASNVYSQLLDGDRVRVLEVRFKPGDKAPMHTHPDHVVYVFEDSRLKLSFPDGRSQEFALKAGQVLMIPAGPHQAENVGAGEAHNLVIELKGKR